MINLIKKKGINPQDKSVLYFPQWTRVQTTNVQSLAKRMARNSTFSVGEVGGMFQDFPDNIVDELLAGNAVEIAGLGTFKLKVQGKSSANIDEVTTRGCKISVVFEPAASLTSRLNDESEMIFVKVPTVAGVQDAEGTDDNTADDGEGTEGTDTEGTGTEGGGENTGNTGDGGGDLPVLEG